MFVHFRKRLPADVLNRINEVIALRAIKNSGGDDDEPGGDDGFDEKPSNKGKLLIDATRTPADITYPIDLKLLKTVREKTKKIT